jgi:hypothetical protein
MGLVEVTCIIVLSILGLRVFFGMIAACCGVKTTDQMIHAIYTKVV